MARDPKTGRFPKRPEAPKTGQLYAGQSGGDARGKARLVTGAHNVANKVAKAERVEALLGHLEHLAFSAEAEAVQVNAAVAALKHLAPDANTEATIGAAVSRVPVKDEAAWEAEHGAETDLGAAAGAATRPN